MEFSYYNPLYATQLKIRQAFREMRNGIDNHTPFAVGRVEQRMTKWAKEHNVEIGSQSLYMSVHSIQHSVRDNKVDNGLQVSERELEMFPIRRHSMDLYYDNKNRNFHYVDSNSKRYAKYVIEPNYKVKMLRGGKVKVVAYITAQRLNTLDDYKDRTRYTKI